MGRRPKRYDDVEACVEDTLRRVGRRIVLGTPLGLGKANHLVNAFYRRACADPSLELHLFTALTLGRPRWSSDLERRFVEPLAERLFGDYPELAYVDPLRSGDVPDNVRISEFYFQPGSLLHSPLAQQQYISSNYTHAVRDLLDTGVNVLAQLVGVEEGAEGLRYSLSCNPDLTLDLAPPLRAAERQGRPVALLAQVNRNLPFMYGDAAVGPDYFDAVVDAPRYDFPLFGPPNQAISTVDYGVALHVSALIRDGGTLQIGIGSLGDAITYLLKLRHERPATYRDVLTDADIDARYGTLIDQIGGRAPFEQGLYASSEMLVDGFLELRRSGILRRTVYDHATVQRLLNEGAITEVVSPATLDALMDAGVITSTMTADDVALLRRLGILLPEVTYEDGRLQLGNGSSVPADLSDPTAFDTICTHGLGDRLRGGHFAHASFFVGPPSFYERLRHMDHAERAQIGMTSISYVNELYGDEALKRHQRRAARFVNTGLIATLDGAVASDGLADGRVISGVGGQYNFVAMAHALEDGRSILMIRSTTEQDGEVQSNIRWRYGHVTIPRHLRDFVVTEYGIADLRGRTDEEVATALIEIADARFQDELLEAARDAGKISASYRIPDHARSNRPDRLEDALRPYRAKGLFPSYPFGTDLTEEEQVLQRALTRLKATMTGSERRWPEAEDLYKTITVPEQARPYLERMALDDPQGPKEVLLQRAVVYALAEIDAL